MRCFEYHRKDCQTQRTLPMPNLAMMVSTKGPRINRADVCPMSGHLLISTKWASQFEVDVAMFLKLSINSGEVVSRPNVADRFAHSVFLDS